MSASQRPRIGKSGKPLLWAAAALVGIAGLGVVALLRPSSASRPEQTDRSRTEHLPAPSMASADWSNVQLVSPDELERSPSGEADSGALLPPTPTRQVVDLFAAPAPAIIERGHEFAASGRPLRSSKVKEVYDFGKQHPGDARPHIILALDSMNRSWYDFAISHYKQATREDPRAKQDPRVLRDLIRMTGMKHQGAKATDAVIDIYGAEALPEVTHAIAEAEQRGEAGRVESLLELKSRLENSQR